MVDQWSMDDESMEYYYYMLVDLAYGEHTTPIKKQSLRIKMNAKIENKNTGIEWLTNGNRLYRRSGCRRKMLVYYESVVGFIQDYCMQ